MITIRPSYSRDLTESEIAAADKALSSIDQLPNKTDEWSHRSHRRNREALNHPRALRFMRLLCQNFSGYSIYHNDLSSGTNLPDIVNMTDDDLDRNWIIPDPDVIVSLLTKAKEFSVSYNPPLLLGEAGWLVDKHFVSFDTIFTQEKLHFLHNFGLLHAPRILEIGAGYGALALGLKTVSNSYTIVDLPDSLAFSATYLSLVSKESFRFITPSMSDDLDENFDLIINTLSFAEMPSSEVHRYAQLISQKWLAPGGILFEQNYDNDETPIRCKPILEKYLSRSPIEMPGLRGTVTLWAKIKDIVNDSAFS